MWMNWFQKRKKDDVLSKKVERIEKLLENLMEKDKIEIHVHHLNVEGPLTENLTYELDKIDVDTLSGSLNLGNNFGVDLVTKSKTKQKQSSSNTAPQTESQFTPNTKGFSFRYDEDDKEVT
jgi:hypothetical protein